MTGLPPKLPTVTANCFILIGWIVGMVSRPSHANYRVVGTDLTRASITFEHENGNRYEATVRQISGTE